MGRAMPTPFWRLTATHNPHRWYLPLDDRALRRPPQRSFMFGGVGLAGGDPGHGAHCGRPVIWATAQYLSFARPPSVVDLDVWVPAHGHNTSQARVIGHVGDKEIFTVNAALASRPSDISHMGAGRPRCRRRRTARRREHWRGDDGGLHSRIELRNVHGRYGDQSQGGELSQPTGG